jgi:predicted nucleotidyltransferase
VQRALESLEQDLEERFGGDVDLVLEENLHPAVRALIKDEAIELSS